MKPQERGKRAQLSAPGSALLLAVAVLTACSQPSDGQVAPRVAPDLPVGTASVGLSPSPSVEQTVAPEPSPGTVPAAPTPTTGALDAEPAGAARTESFYSIEIRRLGIKLPVIEGDVPRDVDRAQTPEHYAFHLPGTAMFGPGNTYIYAHARVGMFLNLWNARLGDLVVVETPKGTIEYTVAEIHPRVPPTEVSWAGPTSDTRLTLQTSTGPNGSDPRFVVVARPR